MGSALRNGFDSAPLYRFLNFLALYPRKEFTVKEFQRETRIPIATVYRNFRIAERLGMIVSTKKTREWMRGSAGVSMCHSTTIWRRRVKLVYEA